MISTNNISMQFGSSPLFEGINITFNEGNKYGLIGANGSGKSTFMKILSGELESTSGNIKIDPSKRVATLKQNQFAYEDVLIIDCVIMGHKKLWDIKTERERIYALEEMSEEESGKVANLEIEFSELNGYTAEADANKLLLGLGIPMEFHDKKMSTLAPGLKLRVLLAQALFGDPDILLLDEPTNHLDAASVQWFQEWIKTYKGALVLVTHDRYVLDKVTSTMVEIDRGQATKYFGNYSKYLEQKVGNKELEKSSRKKFQGVANRPGEGGETATNPAQPLDPCIHDKNLL